MGVPGAESAPVLVFRLRCGSRFAGVELRDPDENI